MFVVAPMLADKKEKKNAASNCQDADKWYVKMAVELLNVIH